MPKLDSLPCRSVSVFCLGLVVISGVSACVESPSDVRPSIESTDLHITGSFLQGTFVVSFENLGDGTLSIERPELEVVGDDKSVGSVLLTFPDGFDASFEKGQKRSATFTVDDDGWSGFCGKTLTLAENHRTLTASGNISTSLGENVPADIPCD